MTLLGLKFVWWRYNSCRSILGPNSRDQIGSRSFLWFSVESHVFSKLRPKSKTSIYVKELYQEQFKNAFIIIEYCLIIFLKLVYFPQMKKLQIILYNYIIRRVIIPMLSELCIFKASFLSHKTLSRFKPWISAIIVLGPNLKIWQKIKFC